MTQHQKLSCKTVPQRATALTNRPAESDDSSLCAYTGSTPLHDLHDTDPQHLGYALQMWAASEEGMHTTTGNPNLKSDKTCINSKNETCKQKLHSMDQKILILKNQNTENIHNMNQQVDSGKSKHKKSKENALTLYWRACANMHGTQHVLPLVVKGQTYLSIPQNQHKHSTNACEIKCKWRSRNHCLSYMLWVTVSLK